jgi:hypothetical protein
MVLVDSIKHYCGDLDIDYGHTTFPLQDPEEFREALLNAGFKSAKVYYHQPTNSSDTEPDVLFKYLSQNAFR